MQAMHQRFCGLSGVEFPQHSTNSTSTAMCASVSGLPSGSSSSERLFR